LKKWEAADMIAQLIGRSYSIYANFGQAYPLNPKTFSKIMRNIPQRGSPYRRGKYGIPTYPSMKKSLAGFMTPLVAARLIGTCGQPFR
jgi:hypothetical protein